MTAESWQLLLAAELPPAKLRALERELGAFPSRPEDTIRGFKQLSKAEADRIASVEMNALRASIASGAVIREPQVYPPQLAATTPFPPALFSWGDWDCLRAPTVAIVGTREATTYGRATAQKFAEHLASAGVTIVSGGAIGIDAAAHKGALKTGRTVAVVGHGIDKSYPALHRGLFAQIRESGCLVSQFAAGLGPSGYRFIVRNGLIAALSQALLVVEAPARSGALSTAHAANDLGRQVFVVPANIDNEKYRGSHELIRSGATLVDHPDQILMDLGVELPTVRPRGTEVMSGVQKKIVEAMSVEPVAAEKIAEETGLAPADVMSELTMLELAGRVMRDAGGYALRP